ncbi:hypothetical protein [Lacticaseibacillus paracasei]|uniref:hypothetical protein n=1 Tax=Lacticaseibacillus paracasei TaxID=1597 RepID=UPI002FFA8027
METRTDAVMIRELLEEYSTNIFLTSEETSLFSTYISLIFKTENETKMVSARVGLKIAISWNNADIIFKNNLLEIFVGLHQGIPMLRTQRTLIEALARLCLTIYINSLIVSGIKRNHSPIKELESAVSSKKVKKLTRQFSKYLNSVNLSETEQTLTSTYETLNNVIHGNPGFQYPEYLDQFVPAIKDKIATGITNFRKELELSLICLMSVSQSFTDSPILSRADFAWIEKNKCIVSLSDIKTVS